MEFYKTTPSLFKWLLPFLTIAIIILHWLTDSVKIDNLLYDVNQQGHIALLETPYIYVYLHLFAFLPVFSLSFDKKVAYYKNW